MQVGIIGGAGHVGLPLGVVMANAGNPVVLIDHDEDQLRAIEAGEMPYREPGGEEALARAINSGRLSTSGDLRDALACDVIVTVVGTPIDEHHNPRMGPLLESVEELAPGLDNGQLLVLRSTVYPGTTRLVENTLESAGLGVGEDVYLSFAPERTAQHNAFEEVVRLPQLVGAVDEESHARTVAAFDTFLEAECRELTPTEAELGKLFTNMWRYLTFAAANEFYLITESFATHHDVNVHRILEQTEDGYPRFDVPSPGANVGGPCLTKDGWFLVDNIPFNELVSAAYQINEGMPAQIIDRMATERPDPEKIGILGMTFKANSDDTRNSLSFKMRKQLQMKGMGEVIEIEPNVSGFDSWQDLQGCDWVILMTPHDQFTDLTRIQAAVDDEDCLYCDLWGFWDKTRESDNGYFRGTEIQPDRDTTEATLR